MTRVFVYGSLLAGEPNHRLLLGARFIGAAQTPPGFRMYDLGAFPGVVVEHCDGVVFGEVYEVDDEMLERLDRLEGHPRFYRRTAIRLATVGLSVDTYLLAPYQVLGRPAIPSGNWRSATGAWR